MNSIILFTLCKIHYEIQKYVKAFEEFVSMLFKLQVNLPHITENRWTHETF